MQKLNPKSTTAINPPIQDAHANELNQLDVQIRSYSHCYSPAMGLAVVRKVVEVASDLVTRLVAAMVAQEVAAIAIVCRSGVQRMQFWQQRWDREPK